MHQTKTRAATSRMDVFSDTVSMCRSKGRNRNGNEVFVAVHAVGMQDRVNFAYSYHGFWPLLLLRLESFS